MQLFDGGMAYADVVKLAVGTELFAHLAEYSGLLNSGVFTQDSLGLLAAQVSFNAASVELVGLASTGIEFTPQES